MSGKWNRTQRKGIDGRSFDIQFKKNSEQEERESEERVEEEEEGVETLSLSSQMLLVMFAVNLMLNLNLL